MYENVLKAFLTNNFFQNRVLRPLLSRHPRGAATDGQDPSAEPVQHPRYLPLPAHPSQGRHRLSRAQRLARLHHHVLGHRSHGELITFSFTD